MLQERSARPGRQRRSAFLLASPRQTPRSWRPSVAGRTAEPCNCLQGGLGTLLEKQNSCCRGVAEEPRAASFINATVVLLFLFASSHLQHSSLIALTLLHKKNDFIWRIFLQFRKAFIQWFRDFLPPIMIGWVRHATEYLNISKTFTWKL